MVHLSRPYRSVALLLVATLTTATAAPLAAHLCAGGQARMAHACCDDPCPERVSHPADAASYDQAPCCATAPAAPAETFAVHAPEAPRAEAALTAVLATARAHDASTSSPRLVPSDTGPPLLHVRAHLALSVLLI